MDILGLSTSPSSGGAYALILNEVDGPRRLPIIIGTYEAQAIALELEHIKPPRPMTHDLLRQMVLSFNGTLRYVLISELREGTFYAQIVMESEFSSTIELDARPSDAIALAIRFAAPIYVSDKVLKDAGIDSDEDTPGNKPASEKGVRTSSVKESKTANASSESIDSQMQLLEKNLQAAISAEDYELAARLRDELLRLKG